MDLFFQAVELTGIYWRMVFELTTRRERSSNLRSDAEAVQAGSPECGSFIAPPKRRPGRRQEEILRRSPGKIECFGKNIKENPKSLNQKKILKINPKDVGKFEK